jgi:hypothetical protein
MKLPLLHKSKIHALEGHFALGTSRRSTIRWMARDRTLLSNDASLAIPTCALRFEVFGSPHCTRVRPMLLSSQIGPHQSDRPGAVALQSSVLALWHSQGTHWFCGEPLQTPWA